MNLYYITKDNKFLKYLGVVAIWNNPEKEYKLFKEIQVDILDTNNLILKDLNILQKGDYIRKAKLWEILLYFLSGRFPLF